MKKILSTLLTILILSFASLSWGAVGTIIEATLRHNVGSGIAIYTYTMTAGTGAEVGTFPDTTTSNIHGYVYMVVTDPSATSPTDDYDITLVDEDGIDVMEGTLGDRDEANTEQETPLIGGAAMARYVDGPLIINVDNNSVSAAVITMKIYIFRSYD